MFVFCEEDLPKHVSLLLVLVPIYVFYCVHKHTFVFPFLNIVQITSTFCITSQVVASLPSFPPPPSLTLAMSIGE
jgi:hypothetical protein